MKKKISLSEAASVMGRKGGLASGKCKARKGTGIIVKKWWASSASIPFRAKKNKEEPTTVMVLESPQLNGGTY